MREPRIFVLTGPPAAGKTTVSRLLLDQFPLGFHLPIDDIRTWVTSGMADSVPWTDETERQFQIAETAAALTARTYVENGFTVALDHCRNIARWNTLITDQLGGIPVTKVLLLPNLATNFHRSHTRTNKPFDKHLLDDTIRYTSEAYNHADLEGWLLIDSTDQSPEQTVATILQL